MNMARLPSLLLALVACGGTSEADCLSGGSFAVYATAESGVFSGCTFPKAGTFHGVTCRGKPHETLLWPDGAVFSCTLDAPLQIRGASLPAGTAITLQPDGTLASYQVYNEADGPPATVQIDGETCTHGSYWPDGKPKHCARLSAGAAGATPADMRCWDRAGTVFTGLEPCQTLLDAAKTETPGASERWHSTVYKR